MKNDRYAAMRSSMTQNLWVIQYYINGMKRNTVSFFTVIQIVSLYPFSEFINRHSLPQIRKLAQMINPDDNTLEKELNLKMHEYICIDSPVMFSIWCMDVIFDWSTVFEPRFDWIKPEKHETYKFAIPLRSNKTKFL